MSQKRKRILIMTNSISGLYKFRFELIQQLVKEKYEVFFSVPQNNENYFVKLLIESDAKHVCTPFKRRSNNIISDLKLINSYNKIIKRIKPDIVLTYTIKPNIYGTMVSNKLNIPVISNVTGLGSSLTTGKFKNIMKTMYVYGISKATTVFFQNNFNMEFFIKNNMVDKNKTKLIPGSGVNLQQFVPISRLNDINNIKFLFIGRVMKDKGIGEYMQVAKNVKEKCPGTEFQVLGSIEDECFREKLNNDSCIKYLGVSKDVRNEIKGADCIVNPSYHEGMSNVLLEGAAMGRPLLASDIPGCKEIIDDGVNGFLFEPGSIDSLEQAVCKFLGLTIEERALQGVESRNKIEKEFDRNIIIDIYIKEIQKILGEDENETAISEN